MSSSDATAEAPTPETRAGAGDAGDALVPAVPGGVDGLYHYFCDDLDDRGWGCVYRSVQNAVNCVHGVAVAPHARDDAAGEASPSGASDEGFSVPSIRDFLKAFKLDAADKPWTEPAMYANVLPTMCGLTHVPDDFGDDVVAPPGAGGRDALLVDTALLVPKDGSTKFMKHSTPDQYRRRLRSPDDVYELVVRCVAAGGAAVVDDGTSGYAVVPVAGDPTDGRARALLLDPHTVDADRVCRPYTLEFVRKQHHWMVMLVLPTKA